MLTDNWKLILTWLLNNQVEIIDLENWLFTNSLDMFYSRLDIAEGEVSKTEDGLYWNGEIQRMKNKRGKEIWGMCGNTVTCMWLKPRRGLRE